MSAEFRSGAHRHPPAHAARDLLVEGQFFFFKHGLGRWAIANALVYVCFLAIALIFALRTHGQVPKAYFGVVVASYFFANALFIPFLGRIFHGSGRPESVAVDGTERGPSDAGGDDQTH